MIRNFLSNINIHLNYGSLTTCDEGWVAHNIICSFHKLYFVTDGNCVIEVDGVKHRGKRGTLFFIPANTRHSYYQEDENYVTKLLLEDMPSVYTVSLQSTGEIMTKYKNATFRKNATFVWLCFFLCFTFFTHFIWIFCCLLFDIIYIVVFCSVFRLFLSVVFFYV